MISNIRKYTFVLLSLVMMAACSKPFADIEHVTVPSNKVQTDMDVNCSFTALSGDEEMTKGIIGHTSTANLEANFIKYDEARNDTWMPNDYTMADFTTWPHADTKIINADILSTHESVNDIFFRSVVFKPRQTYQYSIIPNEMQGKEDIVGYVSRMIGWYPRTFEVPVNNEGVYADKLFKETSSYEEIPDDSGQIHECVVFKNKLDGKTDIMMTDMRMGRIDLRHNSGFPFKNNNNDMDIQPYGHEFNTPGDHTSNFAYCNYFTFNHYLTAVRVYIYADKADMNLVAWKQINDVVFKNQPQTVAISLPSKQSQDNSKTPLVAGTTPSLPVEGVTPIFGNAIKWSDLKNMQIIKTPMASDDPEHPHFAEVPTYPIVIEKTSQLQKTYLGYMLVRPDKDTEIELHTDAGVLTAVIPRIAKFIDKDDVEKKKEILKAGNIYNINIKVNSDGSLDMILAYENDKVYKNLAPYNPIYGDFEYSNCYVITPEKMKIEGNNNKLYDGFYFHATAPGRGSNGFLEGINANLYPSTTEEFQPHTAKILWQDLPDLITHVELIHDHIRFTLNPQCQSTTNRMCGNAVIAAYDKSNQIIWSWHIWVTDQLQDITYPTLQFNDVEDGSFGNDIYNPQVSQPKTLTDVSVMNMNLGATLAIPTGTGDVLKTYGLYYQWGRKDPSPGPPAYNYAQADMSTAKYYYLDHGERTLVYEIIEPNPIVELGARSPLGILATSKISETYPNDWLYSSIDYLWGYSPTAKKITKKTIYDPCPYGYRVADDELWALFYDGQYGKGNVSLTEDTINPFGVTVVNGQTQNFFPYTGWKGHDRGRTDKTHAWFEVGNLGDYQDARVCKNSENYNNHRGRSLIIKKSMVPYSVQDVKPVYIKEATQDYANRTSASPVRCVRYNDKGEEPPYNIK